MVKTYLARFPVSKSATPSKVTECVKGWIIGSPHKDYTDRDLTELDQDGFTQTIGGVSVMTLANTVEGYTVVGHRVDEEKDGRIWRTDIVYADQPKQVSVAQHFESREQGRRYETRKSPRIVTELLKNVGGGTDIIQVMAEPHFLKEYDVDAVVRLMKAPEMLPVVYLSRTGDSLLAVSPYTAATTLAGLAHVVVEPSPVFSHILRREIPNRNAFRGAVGVYWSNGMYRRIAASDDVLKEVFAIVRDGQINSVSPRWQSIDGIRTAKSFSNIEQLRILVSEQSLKLERQQEELLEGLITELDEKERRIIDLEANLGAIHAHRPRRPENSKLVTPLSHAELYSGEVADMVLDAVGSYLKTIPSDSRRAYLLKQMLEASEVTGERDKILQELSRILLERNFDRQSAALQRLGFEVHPKGGGKHPAISIEGCPIKVTMPSTAGDVRSGKNSLTNIKHKLL